MGVMVKNKVARFFMDHGVYTYIYTVSQKNCAKLFLSQVCQMSTKFDNFWHTDRFMWGALIFHLT